ncbi:MAG: SpoIIE family protein phosphatase, partial [Bacteroidales bacterium]|nr:SpoIIE family protein phosphatase [Bacteroidales bacterium]
IHLQPIKKDILLTYLADTFDVTKIDDKFEAFSKEIFNKTLGNPYFCQELITNLYENNYLKFDFKHNHWIWDFQKIKSFAIAKNVADLLLLKINKKDKKLTDLLKIAACIGEKFESDILFQVTEIPIEEAQEITEKAISSKLIFEYESGKYRFIHPDIYREYLKDIDSTLKKELDFKIGTYINQNTPHLIFKLLEHYNGCNDLFTSHNQQIELAKLNLKAGEKSISLIAYDIAFEYFETAINIVNSSYWKSDYSFMLELYTLSAETSYLCTNYKRCAELVDQVLNNAHSIHDKTRAYLSKIKSLISRSKYDEALELGISVLKFLGVNRLGLPQWVLLIKELFLSFKNVYFKDLSILIKFEKQADPISDSIFQISKYLASAAFHTGSSMIAYLCFKSLNLISSKKIQFEDTHYSLISYGMLIAHTFGNIKKAKQISIQVENYYFNEKFNHLIQKTAVINYHMINHLHRPIATGIQPFFENFERSLAHGDVEFAANSIMLHAYYIFWAGGPLAELQQAINKSAKELKALNFLTFYYCIKSLQQFVHNQTAALSFSEVNIEGTYYKESRMVLQHQNNHDITSLNTVYYLKLMQNVLFENYPEAYKAGLEVKKYMKANYGTPTIPLIQMYFSISIAKVYANLSNEEKRNTKSFFKSSVKKLKKFSIFAPENYLHKYLLLKALYSENIAVNLNKAALFYSKAVKSAKKSNISNEIALTYELAAKYLIKQENSEVGEIYLFNAWKQYKNWGGKAKATQLYQQYGKRIKQFIIKNEYDANQSFSGEISQEGLDIESIIKASQMISEELKIKELQEKLIRVVMQNAGAQKGVLIGIKDNELYVLTANGAQTNSDSKTNSIFPLALASYVYRNATQCVFDNLTMEKRFNADNYVIKHKPKSVVCSPVLFKQKVQGIIYLENNLLEGAFNPGHVSIINLLSSQIAISLENAQLYENLEAKVKQRTLELNVANRALKLQNKKVEELYQSVTDSIQSAYRIQQAMLPPKEILQQNLKDFFILFKPRNVVSGDFYWYKKEQDKLYIAAADCTGHGVPGAFMSILGILLLNDIIVAHPKIKASEILERLRELIKISLKQTLSSNSLSDGIDIAFCVVDTNTKVLEYSGAYNPLFLMRNNELVETKATRNPVGIYLKEMPFVNHEIALEPNDKIYLFSDGFIDQMGGPKGYKFMTQKFKTLLLENQHKPMAEQAKIYEKTFERWKGEAHDQTDDVLLIGFEYF